MLKGDESIVNCVQPHPNSCFLATSGIDSQVRIWSPRLPDVEELIRKHKKKDSSIESEMNNPSISSSHDLDDYESDEDNRVIHDIRAAEINNHMQMNSHPFEFLFLNLAQSNKFS